MRLHHAVLLPLLLAQVMLLSSCRPWLEVKLASSNEVLPAPAFTVEEPSQDGKPPRYNAIYVLAEDGTQVWFARAHSFGETQSRRIVYGEEPRGFETVDEPQPLERGRLYRIEVAGEAAGTLRFVTGQDGSVRPEKE
ncbi:hypothetical protein D7V80_11745 [Corallococcus sp. CA054B]|uniref:hypothetical protein n=1 Tax=Corallococcus sp. CA054B TaxID=2316734 RepID=UPI000EA2C7A1|nr:hypothetical protein [Corallococcus sp. CA054B]RKG68663.1 hypothetical protein D7V80_11745 [Corallococcus sp. CA054B]